MGIEEIHPDFRACVVVWRIVCVVETHSVAVRLGDVLIL